MAVPRLFAFIVGILTAAYFGFGLARAEINLVVAAIMLLGALLLFVAAARKGATPFRRWAIAWLWVAFTVLSAAGLAAMLFFDSSIREKAMAMILFCAGLGFGIRSLWQAGRRKRHRWDTYFDQ